jgi:hypothetical protein
MWMRRSVYIVGFVCPVLETNPDRFGWELALRRALFVAKAAT